MKHRFANLTPIHEISIKTKPAFDGLDGNQVPLPLYLNVLRCRLPANDFQFLLLETVGKGLRTALPYLHRSSLFTLTEAFIDHCSITNPVQYFEYKTATVYSQGLFVQSHVVGDRGTYVEVQGYPEISRFWEEFNARLTAHRFYTLVVELMRQLLGVAMNYRRDRLLIDVFTAYQKEYEVLARPSFN
jgi:hypothetical protein